MTALESPVDVRRGIAGNILETIGNTPLVRLSRFGRALKPTLLAKVEYFNPGGSTKDRVAIAMIRQAEENGLLKPGGTIVEATAGNTGLGLALASSVLGYRCIFVMPDKMSQDKIRLLRAYGAEVVITPTSVPPDSPESYNGVANRLAREIPGAWRPNQFGNLSNPEAHYRSTGPEIWEQTEGRVTHFVAGAGTGGTLSGVGKFLKEQNPNIKVIGADIEGSVLSGDSPKPWKVEGIGEDFVPSTLNAQMVDEWIRVSDQVSFATARRVAREEGILLGGSSGTALGGAVKYAARLSEDDMVVVLCPDTGRNYLSKMYDDEWMSQNGFTDAAAARVTLGNLIEARLQKHPMLSVCPDDTLGRAVELLDEYAISQLPVIDDDGHTVGSIQEITVMKLMHDGVVPEKVKVRDVMARALPDVDIEVVLDEVYRLLMAGHPGIVASHRGRPVGIVTRTDLMNFWDGSGRKR